MKKKFLPIALIAILGISAGLVSTQTASAETEHVIVNFDSFSPVNQELIHRFGGTIMKQFTTTPSMEVVLPASYVDIIERVPGVDSVEQNQIYEKEVVPNDPQFSSLYGMSKIQAPEAWDIHTGSGSVIVAVIDEGVDINHEDLAANIWTNPGEIPNNGVDDDGNGFIDDVNGWNFFDGNNQVYGGIPTQDTHGTHVSGTIGGVGNNGVGVVGVSWNVKIMPIKFLGSNGGSTADAIAAVEYATLMGADIISASWGGGGFSQALKNAIDAFPGLFVAAAGNSGINTDVSPHYPSSYTSANIISVASTTSTDARSSFSNYGATSVDLGAPGSSILSTYPADSYATISGTSMATPHVSGAAALVLSHDPSLTTAQLKARLLDNVDPVSSMQGITVSGGRLNVFKAITAGGTPPPPPPSGGSVTITGHTESFDQYRAKKGELRGMISTVSGSVSGSPTNVDVSFTFPATWSLKSLRSATLTVNGQQFQVNPTQNGNTFTVDISSFVGDGDSFSLSLETDWEGVPTGTHGITASVSYFDGTATQSASDTKSITL